MSFDQHEGEILQHSDQTGNTICKRDSSDEQERRHVKYSERREENNEVDTREKENKERVQTTEDRDQKQAIEHSNGHEKKKAKILRRQTGCQQILTYQIMK